MSEPAKPRHLQSERVTIDVTRAIREVSGGNHRPLTIAGALTYLNQLNDIGQWRVIAYLYGDDGKPEPGSPQAALVWFIANRCNAVPHALYMASTFVYWGPYASTSLTFGQLGEEWLTLGLMLQRLIDEIAGQPGGETALRRVLADLLVHSGAVEQNLAARLGTLLAGK